MQKLSRKLVHMLAGPGFVLSWPLFRCVIDMRVSYLVKGAACNITAHCLDFCLLQLGAKRKAVCGCGAQH